MSELKTVDRPLRKDAQLNRDRILRAASELFAKMGLAPSLNDIAHYAGLGVGTVYRRFPTKQALVEAIFADGLDQLAEAAAAALRQQDSWRGFTAFIQRLCEMTATNRGLREIAFSKTLGGERAEMARQRLDPVLADLVARATHDGYLRSDLSHTDIPLIGMMIGAVGEFAGHVNIDLWRRYTSIILAGLREEPNQPRLTVNALDHDEIERVMENWEPAKPRALAARMGDIGSGARIGDN